MYIVNKLINNSREDGESTDDNSRDS